MVGSARDLAGWEEMGRECLDRNLEGVCRPLKVGFACVGLQADASPDPDTTHHQVAGGHYHGLQDCQLASILPRYDAQNNWRASSTVTGFGRVSAAV